MQEELLIKGAGLQAAKTGKWIWKGKCTAALPSEEEKRRRLKGRDSKSGSSPTQGWHHIDFYTN